MGMLIESQGCHLSYAGATEMDKYQATKVAAWETAVAACQQAMQRLQQAKDAQRNSTLSACTPEQALSQYHPSAALEFRQQTQGIVEKAQREEKRRHTNGWCVRSYGSTRHIRDASWKERAAQATRIAQGLEQAATESVEALKTVLHSQSWDHRVVSKMHDDKLRELELEPEVESTLSDFDDQCNKGPKWQKSQQVKQVKLEQERLEKFILGIRAKERRQQFSTSKCTQARRRNDQASRNNQISEGTEALDVDT